MHLLRRAHPALLRLSKSQLPRWPSTTRCLSEEARDRVRALKTGDNLHGYTVQKVEEVPENFITAVLLEHEKTGAQHLHLARDDANNAFSVMFQTTPMDSTGVSHILEHTVLCGSSRFPVRDPFFKMLSRSMATFMNALTAYDWTMYPFSSQNEQDYKNLLSIYLDAVFFPMIRDLDFCQEGWRLEHSDPQDSSSPITFKGIVYNEMKGLYSNSQNVYATQALNSLLPSHTYGVVSGGDPKDIPNLTHQQLKEFHASHYHPSNARFFTYGNLPLDNHLEQIGDTLDKFGKISVNLKVPKEPRWSKPKSKNITCPPDPMAPSPNHQTTVSVSYLLSDITDQYENFVVNLVCYLLVTGETAPFYRALLETGMGSDYAPTTGFHSSTREAIFSVGLSNIKQEDVDEVLNIIDQTLDTVIEEGFEKTRIEALLHRIELSQKTESGNYGFGLSLALSNVWNHGGDPISLLQLDTMLDRFRTDLKGNSKFLQDKVKSYLKDNNHRLTLTMSPDSEFIETRDKEEAAQLATMVSSLTKNDKEIIYKRGLELAEKQNAKEDVSCLPSLKISDLNMSIKPEPIEMTEADWSMIQMCEQPTNGVSVLRMASNLEDLPDSLMPYVPLFCQVITSIGAGGHDFRWMSQQQELYTGGMSASPRIIPHHTKEGNLQKIVLFSSSCLEKNFHKMLDLWTMMMNSPDFNDTSRLSTLIRMCASDLASGLADSGHQYAVSCAASTLNTASSCHEILHGFTQVQVMKEIAEMKELSDIIHKLQSIADLVLDKSSLRLSLNATPTAMDMSVQNIKSFLGNLKGEVEMTPIFPVVAEIEPKTSHTHFELPFSVNYVAQCFPGVRYTNRDYAPLHVLATLMGNKFLHKEIREKGGAYGSGAHASASGIFAFQTYRDPHSLDTLDAFKRSTDWVLTGDFTDEDIQEAKLRVFQQTDKPVTPADRGQVRFLYDISDDLRQKNRDRLFKVDGNDLTRVAQQYLHTSGQPTGVAILGPSNKGIQEDEKWKVIRGEEEAVAEEVEQ